MISMRSRLGSNDQRELLVTQRYHRIDAHGSVGGDIASEQGDHGNDDGDDAEGKGIGGADAVEFA